VIVATVAAVARPFPPDMLLMPEIEETP